MELGVTEKREALILRRSAEELSDERNVEKKRIIGMVWFKKKEETSETKKKESRGKHINQKKRKEISLNDGKGKGAGHHSRNHARNGHRYLEEGGKK